MSPKGICNIFIYSSVRFGTKPKSTHSTAVRHVLKYIQVDCFRWTKNISKDTGALAGVGTGSVKRCKMRHSFLSQGPFRGLRGVMTNGEGEQQRVKYVIVIFNEDVQGGMSKEEISKEPRTSCSYLIRSSFFNSLANFKFYSKKIKQDASVKWRDLHPRCVSFSLCFSCVTRLAKDWCPNQLPLTWLPWQPALKSAQ